MKSWSLRKYDSFFIFHRIKAFTFFWQTDFEAISNEQLFRLCL